MVSRQRHVRSFPQSRHSSARVARPLCANSGPKTQNELLVLREDLRGDSVLALLLLPVPSRAVLTFREVPWAAPSAAWGSATDCANGLVKNVSLIPISS
jgi:hypothetical protein